jgi:Helix-turn-helix domain
MDWEGGMTDRARLPASLRTAVPADGDPDDEGGPEAGIVVRDMRTNERFWIHDTVVDDYGPLLGADAFTIYCSLSCMANKSQYCWPSLARLARHWGKGKGTVVRAIALLGDLQLIHVKRNEREDGGNANNIYYLLEPLPIEEGLAGLVQAAKRRGATHAEAVATAVALLPQNWEPLRRKKGHLRSRDDWAFLLESNNQNLGVQGSTGGSTVEPAGIVVVLGSAGAELDSATDDDPGLPGDHPGIGVARGGLSDESGPVSGRTGPVSPRYSKDQSQEGDPNNDPQEPNHHQGAVGGVVLRTDREILDYLLAQDEVLIENDDGAAMPITLPALARRDIEATTRNWGLRVSTDCYYSAAQFLGQSGDSWTEAEERKRAYHGALRRELEATFQALGAFSLVEALGAYFSADLALHYATADAEEEQRLRGWLAYVRGESGKGLENPAGFLRSRVESGQWPPRGQARKRER